MFDGERYWQITAEYAEAASDDVLVRITAHNTGPERADLHILPTLWFRNRWSWEDGVSKPSSGRNERRRSDGDAASLRGNELEPAIL